MAGKGVGGAPAGAPPQPALGSSFLMFMMLPLLLLVVLTPSMRLTIGLGMDFCLNPVFGFNLQYPLYTILVSGLLMVIATTILRHVYTDWVSVGKQNYLQKFVSQKFKEAQGNPVKLKKVQELNAEIMKMTSERMNTQTKTMLYTMVFSLLLFMWLIVFMYNETPVHVISAPWAVEQGWSLVDSGSIIEFLSGGQYKGPMPNWVLLYSLFSIPIGQVIQAGLKYYSFKKMIERIDRGEPASKPFRLFPKREKKAEVVYKRMDDKDLKVEDGEFEVEDDEDAEVEEEEPKKLPDKIEKTKKAEKTVSEETIDNSEE
jgi:uncharacterized membrane protein (DUF106 family)